jgi:hypothetical protein
LILREINDESVSSLLEKKDAMADCDVAAFVYDRFELSHFRSFLIAGFNGGYCDDDVGMGFEWFMTRQFRCSILERSS